MLESGMREVQVLLVVLLVALLVPGSGWSADHPVAARKLLIVSKAGKEKLVLTIKDPGIGFPTIGSGDDPGSVGMTVQLFAGSGAFGSLVLPATGWSSKPGSYRFDNKDAPAGISPVRKLKITEGRLLKIVSRAAGVQPSATLGSMALRITAGSVRNCALFDASTVVKQDPARFVAKLADAGALADCSDDEVGLPCTADATTFTCIGGCGGAGVCALTDPLSLACSCVDPGDPCGGTSPVCNGTCPAGEFCATFGGGVSIGCGCIEDGQPVCGGIPGVCGGACPSGLACATVFGLPVFGGGPFCTCGGTGACGGGGGITCPPGFGCGGIPGGSRFCIPIDCPGSTGFPSCGGNCGVGATCTSVDLFGFQSCICSPESTACDASCTGYECTPGQACFLDVSGCSCGSP